VWSSIYFLSLSFSREFLFRSFKQKHFRIFVRFVKDHQKIKALLFLLSLNIFWNIFYISIRKSSSQFHAFFFRTKVRNFYDKKYKNDKKINIQIYNLNAEESLSSTYTSKIYVDLFVMIPFIWILIFESFVDTNVCQL